MNITEDHAALFKAISAAQGEFTTVVKDKNNPFFSSRYAPLDSIIEMIRPILAKNGLSVMQFTDLPETGQGVIIETIITHESGEHISGKLFMPSAKSDPQGYGSCITYGRRYALAAALGIVSDEDTDGNQGDKGKKQTAARPETGKEGPKSAPQATNSSHGDTVTAQVKLLNELGEYCKGVEDSMANVLKEITVYPGAQGEKWLSLKDLQKPMDNDKFQKWCGSALGKLRKLATMPTDSCPRCGINHPAIEGCEPVNESTGEVTDFCPLCEQTCGHSSSCPDNVPPE